MSNHSLRTDQIKHLVIIVDLHDLQVFWAKTTCNQIQGYFG